MAVSSDMIETYRRPRVVMRRLLSFGVREDRALAFLMGACLLTFASYLPQIARTAFETEADVTQLGSYAFLMWLMVAPLMFYALGGVLHLIAKLFRGQGTWYTSRLALFWTFLCSTPLLLLYGLVTGFIGQGVQAQLVGAAWVAAMGIIGVLTLREAHAKVDTDGA